MTYDIALIFIYHKEISSNILKTLYETGLQRGINGQGSQEPWLKTLQTLVKDRTIISKTPYKNHPKLSQSHAPQPDLLQPNISATDYTYGPIHKDFQVHQPLACLQRSLSRRRPKNNIQRERHKTKKKRDLSSLKIIWSLIIWKMWFNHNNPRNSMAQIRVGKAQSK